MKIKLKSTYAKPEAIHPIGAEIDVSNSEGKKLVAGGFAIALSKPKVEKAVRGPTEKRKKTKGKKKKKSKKGKK